MAPKKKRLEGAALSVPDLSVPVFIREQAPVQKSENLQEYLNLIMNLAGAVRPGQYLEWIFLKDAADASWEIRRYRRVKTTLIDIAQREQIEKLLKEASADIPDAIWKTIEEITGAKTKAFAWAIDAAARERINEHLIRHGYSVDEVLTRAVVAYRDKIDGVDRLIEAAMARRNEALRNIEMFGRAYAHRLKQLSLDIVDADFEEVPMPANTP